MCALCSSCKLAALRRQMLMMNLRQDFNGPLSISRILSTTTVALAKKEETRKEGFFSKLKDMFNRSSYFYDVQRKIHRYIPAERLVYNANLKGNPCNATIKLNVDLQHRKRSTKPDDKMNVPSIETSDEKKYDYCHDAWSIERYDHVNSFHIVNPRNRYHTPLERKLPFEFQTSPHVRAFSVSLEPRNTKPTPVREPNAPLKRDKKEEKKERKEKKPIIRTTDRLNENASSTAGRYKFHMNARERLQERSKSQITFRLTENNERLRRTLTPIQRNSIVIHNCIGQQVPIFVPRRSFFSYFSRLYGKESKDSDELPSNDLNQNVAAAPTRKLPSLIPMEEEEAPSTNQPPNLESFYSKEQDAAVDIDFEYNIPVNELSTNAELSAWQILVDKSKPIIEKKPERELLDPLQTDTVSIRPEPPAPKLDVEAVKSASSDVYDSKDRNDSLNLDDKSRGDGSHASSAADSNKMNPTRKFHHYAKNGVVPLIPIEDLCNVQVATNFNEPSGHDTTTDSARRSSEEEKRKESVAGSEKREQEKQPPPFNTFQQEKAPTSLHNVTEEDVTDARLPTSVTIVPSPELQNTEDIPRFGAQADNNFKEVYPSYSADISPKAKEQAKPQEMKAQLDNKNAQENIKSTEMGRTNDSEYVRVPGDPYPYSREHFEKWRAPRKKVANSPFVEMGKKNHSPTSEKEMSTLSLFSNNESTKSTTNEEEVEKAFYQSMVMPKAQSKLDNSKVAKVKEENKELLERKFIVSALDEQMIPNCLRGDANNVTLVRTKTLSEGCMSLEKFHMHENLITGLSLTREYHRWTRYFSFRSAEPKTWRGISGTGEEH